MKVVEYWHGTIKNYRYDGDVSSPARETFSQAAAVWEDISAAFTARRDISAASAARRDISRASASMLASPWW